MARIGIDLDGPCYDFPGQFRDYMLGPMRWNREVPDATRWNFYEQYGMTREAFLKYCKGAIQDGWLFTKGDPVPGCKEGIKALRDAGHVIVYITARASLGDEAKEPTEAWLERHGLRGQATLHFRSDKTAIRTDYFLDDKLENYDELDAAGVKVYLWDAPWNQDWTETQFGSNRVPRRRVKSWEEFVNAVREDELVKSPVWREFEKSLDEIRVTSVTGGQKGRKLARFSLIPKKALWKVAELYGKGAEKYDDWNWRKGYNYSLSQDALERHYALWCEGQQYDEETGCHHLAAVVFHCLSLMTFEEEHPEMDDRWKKPEAALAAPYVECKTGQQAVCTHTYCKELHDEDDAA